MDKKAYISLEKRELSVEFLSINTNDLASLEAELEALVEAHPELTKRFVILNIPVSVTLTIPDAAVLFDTLQELGLLLSGVVSNDPKIAEFACYSGLQCSSDLIVNSDRADIPPSPTNGLEEVASNPSPTEFTGFSKRAEEQPTATKVEKQQPATPPKSDSPVPEASAQSKEDGVSKAVSKTLTIRERIKAGHKIQNQGDIVVLNHVEKGAVIAASGDVIIYAACEGVVLAGSGGNTSASIYVNQLRAEAVSIGPYFVKGDQLSKIRKDIPLQISLRDKQLVFTSINKLIPPNQSTATQGSPSFQEPALS